MGADPGITVTGYVPDPRPYLEGSAAFLVPLRAGGGMRVKIPDGWLWGVPIVSTTIGAEGIECHPGEDILIADTPEAFADAVVRLMQDPALGQRLAAAGRRWAEARYDWRTAYDALSELYRGLRAKDEGGMRDEDERRDCFRLRRPVGSFRNDCIEHSTCGL